MKTMLLLSVFSLAITVWTPVRAAQFMELVEDAYEVSAADVQLPNEQGRTMYVKTCSDCAPTAMQTSAKTIFFEEQGTVAYTEFRELLKQNYDSAVYVFYRPGTNEVTRIVVSPITRPSASPAAPPAKPEQDDQRRRPGFRAGS